MKCRWRDSDSAFSINQMAESVVQREIPRDINTGTRRRHTEKYSNNKAQEIQRYSLPTNYQCKPSLEIPIQKIEGNNFSYDIAHIRPFLFDNIWVVYYLRWIFILATLSFACIFLTILAFYFINPLVEFTYGTIFNVLLFIICFIINYLLNKEWCIIEVAMNYYHKLLKRLKILRVINHIDFMDMFERKINKFSDRLKLIGYVYSFLEANPDIAIDKNGGSSHILYKGF